MALNLDPMIRKRKEFLYVKKELKGLGISDPDELDPKQRDFYDRMIEKNTLPTER
jgi:hypothetical protein